ncbi:type II toxin-antitoxin system RelE/ParE family toxin [Gracilinema caldarium]|uniref:type II toxin-antitoxin system RelE/ParE family toxin n=1 Tax=Gracilinema caldarium TaxID=215591 RepID=UPI0026EB73EF|nr:type II toxin-antitoxin system RelE/ParE family toxin [Gracilinema caldarium]
MIQSFGDSETEKIYHQLKSKKLPYEIQKRALVKLLLIDAAESEEDLKVPPGNRFEHLSGRLQGYCSIKINDQWRILFKFMNSNASEVTITDYH